MEGFWCGVVILGERKVKIFKYHSNSLTYHLKLASIESRFLYLREKISLKGLYAIRLIICNQSTHLMTTSFVLINIFCSPTLTDTCMAILTQYTY